MNSNVTNSYFSVESSLFPSLFSYASNVGYNPSSGELSVTLPLLTIDAEGTVSDTEDSSKDVHGTFALMHRLVTEQKPVDLSVDVHGAEDTLRFVLVPRSDYTLVFSRYELSTHNGQNVMSVSLTMSCLKSE